MQQPTPRDFYSHWRAIIERNEPVGDDDLLAILRYDQSDAAVADLIGALASRCLLSRSQTAWLLAEIPKRFPYNDHAYFQVLALTILRDNLRTPTSKLAQLLSMSCDWAAALTVLDLNPYNCGQAFEIINRSSRPVRTKSDLCAAVAAHQKALWAEIKAL
jgi:hypothetical protein